MANSDPEKKIWMAYGVKDDGTLDEGRVFADLTSETAEGLPDGSATGWYAGCDEIAFVQSSCPADLDENSSVDAADLAILLGSWGPCS